MQNKARLIDANAADVERICCYYGDCCRIEDVQEWLDEQPTIYAVEVVRCKECKEYELDCGYCDYWEVGRNVDDYCSRGARR